MVNYEWWMMNYEWWMVDRNYITLLDGVCNPVRNDWNLQSTNFSGFWFPRAGAHRYTQVQTFRFGPWSPNLQIWPLESKPSDLALGVQTFRFGFGVQTFRFGFQAQIWRFFWFPRAGVGTDLVCSGVPFLWACVPPATLARRECVPTPARGNEKIYFYFNFLGSRTHPTNTFNIRIGRIHRQWHCVFYGTTGNVERVNTGIVGSV